MRFSIGAGLLAVLCLAPAAARPRVWKLSPTNGTLEFRVGYLLGESSVKDTFDRFSGMLYYDPEAPSQSRVEWKVIAASVDTHRQPRDRHLRLGDYLDVKHFPTLSFRSQTARTLDPTHLEVSGQFTMHGVTRPLTILVQMPSRFEFSSQFTVLRSDYGMSPGLILASDQVVVLLKLHTPRLVSGP